MSNQQQDTDVTENNQAEESLAGELNELWPLSVQQQYRWDQCQYSASPSANQLLLKLDAQKFNPKDSCAAISLLERALKLAVGQHQSFAARFIRNEALRYPQQQYDNPVTIEFKQHSFVYSGAESPCATSEFSHPQHLFTARARSLSNDDLGTPLSHFFIDLYDCDDEKNQFYVLLSAPSMLCDSQSLLILWAQTSAIFQQFDKTAVVTPKDDEITQYLDFVAWQQDLNESEDARSGHQYWQQQVLQPLPRVNYLKANANTLKHYLTDDSVDNNLASFGTAADTCTIENDDAQDEREALLLSTWLGLQSRLDQVQQVQCFLQLDVRDEYEELSSAQGLYSQNVPVSAEVTKHTQFNELYAWVSETLEQHKEWLDFYQYHSNCEKHMTETLLQWGFRYVDMTQWSKLLGQPEVVTGEQNPASITLLCLDYGNEIKLLLTWDKRVLPVNLSSQILSAYRNLLQAWSQQPEQCLSQPSLNKSVQLRDCHPSPVAETSVVSQFRQAAQLEPTKKALVFSGEQHYSYSQMNYQQLDEETDRIALALIEAMAHHATPSSITGNAAVAICLQRSADMVVALLSCLKAGIPYIPLEPELHANRLNHLLAHTNASLLLCDMNIDNLTIDEDYAGITTNLTCLLENWGANTELKNSKSHFSEPATDDIAYVIYTSGSSGEPKAVAISHGGLNHYTNAIAGHLNLVPGLQYATVSTLSADLGNTSIFSALSNAGTLHVIDQTLSNHGEKFADYMHEQSIDVLKIVPSHYQALRSSTAHTQMLVPTTGLILGGEIFSIELAKDIQADIRQADAVCKVYNHYGPTETTIGCMWLDLTSQSQLTLTQSESQYAFNSIPIGHPIGDNQCVITDTSGQAVLSGVAGELWITGPGLSLGYLGDNEQCRRNNENSFVTVSFDGDSRRFYKTGDRVRQLECGALEFLGRIDQQVKLRGYRVELNAINQALMALSNVSSAIVQLDTENTQQLVAFCVKAKNSTEGQQTRFINDELADNLSKALHQRLPYYMVPARYIFIEQMPLTKNGKPDTKQLARLATETEQNTQQDYLPPETPTEQRLADIWKVLLKREEIGRHCHFFEAGGHSLLATQFVFRAGQAFSIELSLGQIFDTPILSDLAKWIEQHAQDNSQSNSDSLILPIASAADTPTPLSFSQQRLWFMQHLAPESASYNVPAIIELAGPLNVDALTCAFDDLMTRHSGLLSRFIELNGEPRIDIQSHQPASLALQQRDSQSNQTQAGWLDWMSGDIQQLIYQPFNLTEERLIRVGLYEREPHQYQLVVVMHHIICDGWSRDILVKELVEAYCAREENQSPPWEKLTIEYRDYANWQHQQTGKLLTEQLGYWKDYLGGEHHPLQLHARQQRPSKQQFNGKAHRFIVPNRLVTKLRKLANENNTTLFTLTLAAYHVLLLRYSNQSSVRVGIPISGRNRPGLDKLVGLLTNTLVTCSSQHLADHESQDGNDESPPFSAFLEKLRQDMRLAFEHQDLPFEMLVEQLQPQRSLSHSPLFQAFFSLQPAHTEELQFSNLDMRIAPVDSMTSKFDLSLLIEEKDHAPDQDLAAQLEYDSDLFDQDWIAHLAQNFLTLLNDICIHPDLAINQLRLVSDVEQVELLSLNPVSEPLTGFANSSDVAFSLMAQMAEQMLTKPAHVALMADNKAWLWSDVGDRVAAIASYLQQKGVGPNDRVVLCLQRSVDVVFSMLATLRCGACFVPLDPALPIERQQYIIEQCRADIVLLDAPSRTEEIDRNVALGFISEVSSEPSVSINYPAIDPNSAAYILYTSGSTGKPKGVEISLAALDNLLYAMQQILQLNADDQWLAITSISFDISLLEILLPLCTGSRLVLANSQQARDPEALIELLIQHPITVMQATPGAWRQLLDCGWQATRPTTLLCGGEALVPKLANDLLPQAERLLNVYGPTEATIWACCKEITCSNSINLGKPITNYRCHVVNPQFELQPIGTQGQLVIAGQGLAQGYFDRSDLTNGRFILAKDGLPYSGRLYLTGDLASYDEHGDLHYHGRSDDQIKWRGYRIEPDEIARTLEKCSTVSMAFVMLHAEQLLAFYSLANEEQSITSSSSEVLEEIKQWLPTYMLPTQLLALTQFPLTNSGKVDRQALLSHWHEQSLSDKDSTPSAVLKGLEDIRQPNPLEQKIIELWQQVLPNVKVGVSDDFFALGGHSLLLTRLLANMREHFTCNIALHNLFEASTPEQQARLIGQNNSEPMLSSAQQKSFDLPIADNFSVSAPLSYAQKRIWFLDRFIRESGENPAAYHIPVAAQLTGELDIEALQQALSQVIAQHQQLHTEFKPEASDKLTGDSQQDVSQHVVSPANICLQQVALNGDLHSTLSNLINLPIDLTRAPLMNAWLIKRDQQAPILLLVLHHLIADGWSLQLLLRDLFSHYQAITTTSENHSDADEDAQISTYEYTDYARWQQSESQVENQQTQLQYWHQYLAGDLPTLNLPTDKPRPNKQSYSGQVLRLPLDRELSQQLNTLAKRQKCSRFVLLMAAWSMVLSRYSGQQQICIGTPIANRHTQGTENICGVFANTQVYRCDLKPEQPLSELLAAIQVDSIAAQKNQDVPFEKLVETLGIKRDTSRTPLFQSLLTVQESQQHHVNTGGIAVEFIRQQQTNAKFDISLAVDVESDTTLHLALEYNTSLFYPQSAANILTSLQNLLREIAKASVMGATDDMLPIRALSALSQSQMDKLSQPNQTDLAFPLHTTLLVDFAKQVYHSPDALAVVMDTAGQRQQQHLTYRQFDRLTDRLALDIRSRTKGQHNPVVAVMMDRSLAMVVSLWASLKAGAAYLPLNPELPAKRLAFMLENARCTLAIGQPKYQTLLSSLLANPIILDNACKQLDSTIDLSDEQLADALAEYPAISVDDIAYVLYTSGTTGQPKGVAVPHTGLKNRILWQQSLIPISAEDRVLQKTPYSFDVSVWEFFWPMMTGATLVVAAPEAHKDPAALLRLIEQQRISVMHFVPSMLHLFAEEMAATREASRSTSLKTLICSGEALGLSLTRKTLALLPNTDLYNLYGPTEASIDVSYWHCNQILDECWQGHTIPIGQPIANTQLYVLDKDQHIVPPGAHGELYIAGTGLASAYIGQPELTAERFVQVMVAGSPIRMYRTGDLARWTASKNGLQLEYIGRSDQQLKLRGQRLELTEIEAILQQLPQIEQSTVLADPPHRPERLVACVVASNTAGTLDLAGTTNALRQVLPDWMIPDKFIVVDNLPLSANGKVDRKHLYMQVTSQIQIVNDDSRQLAQTPFEQDVCACIAEVLQLPTVSLDDDLFALGAHSLLMVRLQQMLRSRFGIQTGLTELFRFSVIGDLVEYMQSIAETSSESPQDAHIMPLAKAVEHISNSPTLWCIHPASGYAGPFAQLAESLRSCCNVIGINADSALQLGCYSSSKQASAAVIDEIATDYVQRLQKRQPQGPYYLLGWSLGGHIATAMTEKLESAGHTVGWLGVIDSILQPSIDNSLQPSTETALSMEQLLDQQCQFYHQSLRLIGGADLSTLQLQELRQLLSMMLGKNKTVNQTSSNVNEVNNAICNWLIQRGLLPNGVQSSQVQGMLALLHEGQQLVKTQSTNWRGRIQAPMDIFWAKHTLEVFKGSVGSLQCYSSEISSGLVNQHQFDTDHQNIVIYPPLAVSVKTSLEVHFAQHQSIPHSAIGEEYNPDV